MSVGSSAGSPGIKARHGADIDIRPLATEAELRQCVELQRATWGQDYDDIVPPSVLKVAQKVGGVAAGAFAADGRMVGFVFGMAGVRDGRIIHWSDMLAVREDARDRGVGQQLKDFQRIAARASGATTMYWTYDPLVARNAHVNFNRLGVQVDEYVEDMYGASASDLHRGLGTDRLIVAWPLDGVVPRRPAATPAADSAGAAIVNPGGRMAPAAGLAISSATLPNVVRIEIPMDIVAVRDSSPADAAQWRASTRQAFQWALFNHYTVARFVSDVTAGRGYYLLARGPETGVGT